MDARLAPMDSRSELCPAVASRRGVRPPRWMIAGFVCAVLVAPPTLVVPTAAAGELETAASESESRLPPLPAVSRIEPLRPEAAELDELDSRLQALSAPGHEDRMQAAQDLLQVRPRLVAAAQTRLVRLAERADREKLKRALGGVRERSRKRASDDDAATSDLLFALLEQPPSKDASFRDLVELVALVRVFARIGTVDAARCLIEVYARFGEFIRIDVQNRLLELKDGAVAALIEARRHKAEKISTWAERQLDRLGKAAPGEAIRTDNYEFLADVLRAYGRTRDHDAARIVVSYANNERHQVREAARQAVALMGEVGLWQLREAYEEVAGKRPRRDWSWDRTARELFYVYDRLHVAAVIGLYEAGKKSALDSDFPAMVKAYDAVLARSPLFERAPEMAKDYLTFAERVARTEPEQARLAVSRVERIATDPLILARARSLHATIVAKQRHTAGLFDRHLIERALQSDAKNADASRLLQAFGEREIEVLTQRVRWLTSGAIALVATIAIALVLFWRRPQRPGELSVKTAQPPEMPTDGAEGAPALASAKASAPRPDDDRADNERPSEAPSGTTEARSHPKPRDPFEGL